MNAMSTAFKSKAQQFVQDIFSDVNQQKQSQLPAKTSDETDDPQVYREENRLAQYGLYYFFFLF